MSLIFRILAGVFALTGVGLIAMISIVWVDGQDLSESGGKIWVETHSASLVNLQTVIQRHLNMPELWDNYAVPFLKLPAWQGMLIGAVTFLVLAMLFGLVGRKRIRSGNKFRSADAGS